VALSSRERNMLIGLGVVAVAAGAFFLLTRGGEEPEEAAPTPATSPPPVTPVGPTGPTGPEGPGGPGRPRRTPIFFAGRDPFVPLVAEAATGATGPGATGPAPTAPAPTGPAPTGPGFTDGDGGRDGEDGGQPNVTTRGGREIVLIDVFERGGDQVVQVTIDGETFVAGEGDGFARNFQVVSIDGSCATFLFGDDQFTLCEPGEKK
jgi:hypothetical protein